MEDTDAGIYRNLIAVLFWKVSAAILATWYFAILSGMITFAHHWIHPFLKSDQFVIFIDTESIAVYKLFIPAFITTVQITECQIMLLRIAMCIRLGVCQNAELIADFIVSFKAEFYQDFHC